MLKFPLPDDFHVHVRQGAVLKDYVRTLARSFGRALIMPNTLPPIKTASELLAYCQEIKEAANTVNPDFEPLMTFKVFAPEKGLSKQEILEQVQELKKAGAVAGKLYPLGATTNSEDGVSEIEELFSLFEAMQQEGLLLLIHGEDPQAFVMEREKAFLPQLDRIVRTFPQLKIVLEHVSSADAVSWVRRQGRNVAATVTVHHLLFTLDDMAGKHLNPHLYCKPLLKRPEDRQAIAEAVLSGDHKFFFGSDSAPHEVDQKESCCGAAGIYSAPVALALLAQFFDAAGELDLMPGFVASHGARFYGIPAPQGREVQLVKEPWQVPELIDNIVPLAAGQTLAWKLVE